MSDTRNEELIALDFPEEGELIISPTYSFRLSVFTEAEMVEVSIDGCPWQKCRPASGYWWFDWSGYLSGFHRIACRVHARAGQVFTSPPKVLRVDLGAETQETAPQQRGKGPLMTRVERGVRGSFEYQIRTRR